jgi:AcrR family transcriptional regulator
MTARERRERERLRRRQLIITAAREIAETDGWEAVTTRRLAERIEYSQSVLYSHFQDMDAIIAAVALEGFGELATTLRHATRSARVPRDALVAVVHAYNDFATAQPRLYDAVFTLASNLPFGQPDAPAPLHDAFAALYDVVAPLAGDRDPSVLAELTWSALHGLVTLGRAGRLRAAYLPERLAMLVDLITDSCGQQPADD